MFKITKSRVLILTLVLFLLSLPLITKAVTSKSQETVYVAKDKVIDNNFVRAAGVIEIDGAVNGDVIVVAGTVDINGPVAGDVLALGGTIKITGEVAGSVRVVAGDIEISGKVGKNLNTFGGTVSIAKEAQVGWSYSFGAGTVELKGSVAGHVDGMAGSVILAGPVNGDVNLKFDKEGRLFLYPNTLIKGNLNYNAKDPAEVQEGARVLGQTIHNPLQVKTKKLAGYLGLFGASLMFAKIISLFSLLLIGMILVFLAPKKVLEITEEMIKRSSHSLGWGLVYLLLVPIVAFLLVLTIIGIPLAAILFVLYLIAIYLTTIFVGTVIGQKILELFQKAKPKKAPLFWSMLLGTTVFFLLAAIPFIGWAIKIFGAIWALGAIVSVKKKEMASWREIK